MMSLKHFFGFISCAVLVLISTLAHARQLAFTWSEYSNEVSAYDTDGDRINAGDELAFWKDTWHQSADSGGLISLLDSGADGDGMADPSDMSAGTGLSDRDLLPDLEAVLELLPVVATQASDAQEPNVPGNTQDGDLNTRWSAQGNGQWIMYDLGAPMAVSEVAIAWYQGNRRQSSFTLEVSTDRRAWTAVYSGDSSSTTLELEPYRFAAVSARYVRLVGYGNMTNQWNSVTEVEIYSAAPANPPQPWQSRSPSPLVTMKKVNDYWVRYHADPGNADWNRAAYFGGNMAYFRASGDRIYLDYALQWATQNRWATFGYNPAAPTTNADDQAAGQTYIELYQLDPIPSRIAVIKESIDIQVHRSRVDDWSWIDAIFMSAPVFSKLGDLYRNPSYFRKQFALYNDTKSRRGLFDPKAGLWYRDNNFVYPRFKTPNGKKTFWSRGNGWVMASLPRVLEHLPLTEPSRREYIRMLQRMAGALKGLQRSDGFWGVSLYDPADHPGPETSGTAFFTYAMAWGVKHGLLDRATYMPVVIKAWDGMVRKAVHPDGKLGFVQGVGSRPASSQPVTYQSTTDFGVGAFLLAGSEVLKLGIDFTGTDVPGSDVPPDVLAVMAVQASGDDGHVPANTIDKNLETRWSAQGDGQWIIYDLGAPTTVSEVAIAWYQGDWRQSSFTLEVSTDRNAWTAIYSGDSSDTTLELEPYRFAAVSARYVRLVGYGNTTNQWNSITEVEIWGR